MVSLIILIIFGKAYGIYNIITEIMKHYKKWLVYLLIFLFAIPAMSVMQSCNPSYRNYRKIVKHKRIKSARRYKGRYQRKLRRSSVPIHNNYIMKRSKGTRLHY